MIDWIWLCVIWAAVGWLAGASWMSKRAARARAATAARHVAELAEVQALVRELGALLQGQELS